MAPTRQVTVVIPAYSEAGIAEALTELKACLAVSEVDGAHLLDVAPTLLELSGYDVPESAQGRSWVSGTSPRGDALLEDQAAIVCDRLRGLGYV